jgi:hypothetical protein|tara:strand:- start:2302 stop:2598 length:297 start_codon:yes stop_codon:yes gene_type:complete
MAINGRSPKSVSSIRTHSGRAGDGNTTHRDYFKVGALELERSRRVKERDAANSRLTIINARIDEIDNEKAKLLEAAAAVNDGTAKSAKKEPSGLRIKY